MTQPHLSEPLASTLQPLFETLPPDQAMGKLVVPMTSGDDALVQQVETLLNDPALRDRPDLAAGLWLYIDQLDRSHRISQNLGDQTGSYWHAIMHRREGDFGNSKYWFRRTGDHPAMQAIDGGQYDPARFIDQVERAYDKGQNDEANLVALQRKEWAQLFAWCASQ
jgi:hypothetical protein